MGAFAFLLLVYLLHRMGADYDGAVLAAIVLVLLFGTAVRIRS